MQTAFPALSLACKAERFSVSAFFFFYFTGFCGRKHC